VDRLTDLALALPPAARELVAYRIWESLQSGESWPLAREQTEEYIKANARGKAPSSAPAEAPSSAQA